MTQQRAGPDMPAADAVHTAVRAPSALCEAALMRFQPRQPLATARGRAPSGTDNADSSQRRSRPDARAAGTRQAAPRPASAPSRRRRSGGGCSPTAGASRSRLRPRGLQAPGSACEQKAGSTHRRASQGLHAAPSLLPSSWAGRRPHSSSPGPPPAPGETRARHTQADRGLLLA